MKKKFYFVSAIVVMAMCATIISCEKKDSVSSGDAEDINGCKCTYSYGVYNYRDMERFTIEEMEDYYGVSTCAKLQRELRNDDYFSFVDNLKCTSY